jgi:hypothetical protein
MRLDLTAGMHPLSRAKPHDCTTKPITTYPQDARAPSSPHANHLPRAFPGDMPRARPAPESPREAFLTWACMYHETNF